MFLDFRLIYNNFSKLRVEYQNLKEGINRGLEKREEKIENFKNSYGSMIDKAVEITNKEIERCRHDLIYNEFLDRNEKEIIEIQIDKAHRLVEEFSILKIKLNEDLIALNIINGDFETYYQI